MHTNLFNNTIHQQNPSDNAVQPFILELGDGDVSKLKVMPKATDGATVLTSLR